MKKSFENEKYDKYIENNRLLLNKKLYGKYNSRDYQYNTITINNLIFNEKCRIVAVFKDFLILDDNTEFLRRFYTSPESRPRLNRILAFYEAYSKIFPNYMILEESCYFRYFFPILIFFIMSSSVSPSKGAWPIRNI